MFETKVYYRRLDIIRIISCVLVLLYHLKLLNGGFLAVCTFFALSGYLTCISALKNKYFSIKQYYFNRIKKLYLPLLLVVTITVIIAKINSSINWMNLKTESFSVLFGYNNIWQLNANQDYFTRNVNSPFTHFWYISILFQFDLIFPIIFNIFKKFENKIRKNISTIIVSLLTIVTTVLFYFLSKTQDFMVAYYNSFARSFSILFGVLLALINYRHNLNLSRALNKYNKIYFIIYAIVLTAFCVFLPDKVECYAIFMILTTIISTRLLEYSSYESEKNKKSDIYLKFLSKMTYEIYLVQYPVIFFMQRAEINDVLKVLISAILTFIISFILMFFIESSYRKKIIELFKKIFLCLIIIVGIVIILTAKDYSNEMKDLESRLNENMKFIEEKNKEFLNDTSTENNNNKNSKKNDDQVWNVTKENSNNDAKNTDSNISKTNEANLMSNKKNKKEVENIIRNTRVIGVGDSVLLDATREFYNKFPKGYFDGKINRTIPKAREVLTHLKNNGKLGNIIILCLSTNGDYSEKQNTELMKVLGNRKVYWINAAGPDDPKFNEKFENFAKKYPNIRIVEWDKVAKEHPEYLEPDKIHPNYKGGKVLVQLIFDMICEDYYKE